MSAYEALGVAEFSPNRFQGQRISLQSPCRNSTGNHGSHCRCQFAKNIFVQRTYLGISETKIQTE